MLTVTVVVTFWLPYTAVTVAVPPSVPVGVKRPDRVDGPELAAIDPPRDPRRRAADRRRELRRLRRLPGRHHDGGRERRDCSAPCSVRVAAVGPTPIGAGSRTACCCRAPTMIGCARVACHRSHRNRRNQTTPERPDDATGPTRK